LILPVLVCGSAARAEDEGDWPWAHRIGLEITLTTDKQVYELGEEVHAVHRIYNPYESAVTIQLLYTPGFDLWAMRDDVKVWGYQRGLCAYGDLYHFPPGETVFEYTWDMMDTWGEAYVSPGDYWLVGVIYDGIPVPYHQPVTFITIVPEPATGLTFVVIAVAGLVSNRQR